MVGTLFPEKTDDCTWIVLYEQFKANMEMQMKKVDLMKEKCMAFSLSEEPDNILLWSYYANSHKGYCVEYDAAEIFDQFTADILPVRYQRNFVNLFSRDPLEREAPWRLAYESATTKAEYWSLEKEWRILKTINESEDHYISFPKPTAIYLGCAVEEKLVESICATCVKRKISIYKMKKAPDAYQLHSEQLF